MARQPNHGRDIESEILRVLAEAEAVANDDLGMAVQHIEARLPGYAMSTLLDALSDLWDRRPAPPVHATGYTMGDYEITFYALTEEGRRVAEARGLVRRAEP